MNLEIYSGQEPHDGYIHLDRNPEAKHIELCVDLVYLLLDDMPPEVYPDISKLQGTNLYDEILFHGLMYIP